MNREDRVVRAAIYELFVEGVQQVDAEVIASKLGMTRPDVASSLQRLDDEHRIVLTDSGQVRMAHPFSGVDTGHTSTVGETTYRANCAWDALAILALLGDGIARLPGGIEWRVEDGRVSPSGVVHLLVPAVRFWDDVVFT